MSNPNRMLVLPKNRTEADDILDAVFAAMETGNAGRARTILKEYREKDAVVAAMIRTDVLAEYGIAL